MNYTVHGHVKVECHQQADDWVVTISDTGIGMSDRELAGMFNASNQSDSGSEGLGMGLWIVRRSAARSATRSASLPYLA